MSYFIERRKHYRIHKEIKVKYRFISQTSEGLEEKSYEATTKNLSTTGIMLKMEIPRPLLLSDMMLKKVLLLLEINLPGSSHTIKATAQLKWVESVDINNQLYNAGLKFVDITQEDKNALTKFILSNI